MVKGSGEGGDGLHSLLTEPASYHKAQKNGDRQQGVLLQCIQSWFPQGAPIDQVHQEVFLEEFLARWCAFTHGDASELPLGAGIDRTVGSYQFS